MRRWENQLRPKMRRQGTAEVSKMRGKSSQRETQKHNTSLLTSDQISIGLLSKHSMSIARTSIEQVGEGRRSVFAFEPRIDPFLSLSLCILHY